MMSSHSSLAELSPQTTGVIGAVVGGLLFPGIYGSAIGACIGICIPAVLGFALRRMASTKEHV